MGMPGVYAWGTFDTWSPGYLMFMAATHNGISRLYETFGNSGSADTEERTLSPERDLAHLVPAEPADLAGALVAAEQQQLRADRPAHLAEPLRQQPRLLPAQLLREEQAVDPEGEGRRPRRLRVSGQRSASRRAGRAAAGAAEAGGRDLARDRRVHRDDAGRPAAGGRGAADAAARGRATPSTAAAQAPAMRHRPKRRAPAAGEAARRSTREFPAGSYIVRMDQPVLAHRRRAARLPVPGRRTSRRRGPTTTPAGPSPKAFAVQAVRVVDPRCSTSPMEPVKRAMSRRRAAWRGRAVSSRSITTPTTR